MDKNKFYNSIQGCLFLISIISVVLFISISYINKVYADGTTQVEWTANLTNAKIYYKNTTTAYPEKTANDLKITVTNDVVSNTTDRTGTFNTSDFSKKYKLSVTGIDGVTSAITCTKESDETEITDETSGKELNLTLDDFIVYVDEVPSVKWTANLTNAKIYYKNTTTAYPEKTANDLKITVTNDVVSNTTDRTGTFNTSDFSKKYKLSVTGIDGVTSAITCTEESDETEITDGTSGKELNLTLDNFTVYVDEEVPKEIKWKVTVGSPTKIYYSDGTTEYEGITASKINVKISKASTEKTTQEVEVGGNKEGSFNDDTSVKYTLSVTGCTLSNGAVFSRCDKTIDQTVTTSGATNSLTFDLTGYTIITTASVPMDKYDTLIDNLTESQIETEVSVDEEDDLEATVSDIKLSSFKKILKYLVDNSIEPAAAKIKAALTSAGSKKFEFVLKIEEGSPSSGAKDRIKSAAKKKDAEVGTYINLSLKLKINGEKVEVRDTGTDLSIKIKIPSDDYKSSRKFNIIRDHDEKSKVLNDNYSSSSSISFSTKYFSDYAISYTGSSSSSSSSSNASNVSSSRSTVTPGTGTTSGNAAGGGGSAGGGKAPKTGDDFNAKKWVFFLVIGVVVALCSFILYQDTKEWRDENK